MKESQTKHVFEHSCVTPHQPQTHHPRVSPISKPSSVTLDFPSYSCFRSNCDALQLWIKLCFVSGGKHIRWSVIGHRFRDDSICSSHLNRVQARPVQGLVRWGLYTPDSPGTSRWLRGWPSMAIQSAAVIQGGPTSSYQQVVSFIMRSLSKTNVSCVYVSYDVV